MELLKEISEQIPFIVLVLLLCMFISYQIYLASTDTSSFNTNNIYYFITIFIPLIVLFSYILYGYTLKKQETVLLFVTLGVALTVLLILYIVVYTGLSSILFNEYLLYTVSFAIVIVGLGIVYNVFSERLRRQVGWTGFFINILFYIPCLISDFIKYVIKESNETPRTTFILFVIEILLIIFYFYLLPFIYGVINANSVLLLDKPIMLSSVTRIDSSLQSSDLNKVSPPLVASQIANGQVTPAVEISGKFGLSTWIYINPMSSSKMGYGKDISTNILKYGNSSSDSNLSSHPQISHYVGEGGTNIQICFSNSEQSKYNIMLPYQKWNNIVFNYNGNGVDLFVNGILEYSYLFSNDYPVFNKTDIIIVGQDNGLVNNDSIYGSICNVVYYKNPMTNVDIINNYNLLMFKNPPTR